MQRGDELHDMVNTTGATFLGLTRRLRPLPQSQVRSDFAASITTACAPCSRACSTATGAIKQAADGSRAERVKELRQQLAELDREIAAAEPLAQPAAKSARRVAVSPLRNIERFAPLEAKQIRFTILATNNAEPCIDEMEIFTAGLEPKNVAPGATATSSGNFAGSPLHKLEHINDGRYGNGRSWISNTVGKGWVQLDLTKVETIERIEWARDREGKYADRLPVQLSHRSGHGAWKVASRGIVGRSCAGRADAY